ncbi:MAG: 5-formyltetrahydrofolate cyclo-ligase [Deltaproteobacteria bacterium]|nr:5-formyltetrahydrofolate cyclo-ligase [Deltaproteobacteria bacterium]
MTPDDLRLRARVKDELRARMKAIRRAHPAATREKRSVAAAERIVALPEWASAERVAGYLPIHAELDPRPALERGRAAGKVVVLPRVDLEAQRVVLHRWDGEPLEPGAFGILEPSADAPIVDGVDLILVPALAVDESGHRIGWGKGFYDKLLAEEASMAFRVAVVFQFQLLAECPVTPHDIAVHVVVTDERTIRPEPTAP